MKLKEVVKKAQAFSEPFRVSNGNGFRSEGRGPRRHARSHAEDKPGAKEALAIGMEALCELQDRLYAQDRWAVLLIFQAMDAAGKDGAIKHVMSGRESAGLPGLLVQGAHQRGPRPRLSLALPGACPSAAASASSTAATTRRPWSCACTRSSWRGRSCRRPASSKTIWKERFEDIRAFERYLARNGILIRKFFLHVSQKEQKRRFLERLDEPEKNWKFSANDAKERGYWDDYMEATRTRSANGHREPRGTWSPPTTSGSRAWWWRRRSSTRSPRSTSTTPRSTRNSGRSWRRRGGASAALPPRHRPKKAPEAYFGVVGAA